MAKKMVRGITDVKTITNQDFDTNNVNDLLSDGQYNYIHRKKGKNEEYHNLTDNIKTISSDNTELLSVTNNNKTTNTATLHPKHDKQKEQVIESTRDTITINHGTNGTAEKTTVDTNAQKVLEHENLISDSEYITLDHKTGENTTHIKTATLKEKLDDLQQNKQNKLTAMGGISITGNSISLTVLDRYSGDLNNLTETCLAKPMDEAKNLPSAVAGDGILIVVRISDVITQKYHGLDNTIYTRLRKGFDSPTWTQWVKVTTSKIWLSITPVSNTGVFYDIISIYKRN